HLALLSLRTFETTYDDMVFDLGFVNAERPFLIPLEATTADPFGPEPDGWGSTEEGTSPGSGGTSGASGASGASEASAAADAADPAGASDASRPPATRVDLEGIESRLVPFPVESGSYSHL